MRCSALSFPYSRTHPPIATAMPHYPPRRKTYPVRIGTCTIGSGHPIALQTMANVSTLETTSAAQQAVRCAREGCDIFRYTVQGEREAAALESIARQIRASGCNVPLVADIHFRSEPAFAALPFVEKVRINPGNFTDSRLGYRGQAAALERIHEVFGRFVDETASQGKAIRIGVNHGSLSPRILEKYGNTPQGMVESCMEYLRVCAEKGFKEAVISMKASDVSLMTQAVRLLCSAMDGENMPYPLHLGVTEAGSDEDGRIKSAVGIGSLLVDGLGDTIRVSLSEEPECELRFGRKLLSYISALRSDADSQEAVTYRPAGRHSELPKRKSTPVIIGSGGDYPYDEALARRFAGVTRVRTRALNQEEEGRPEPTHPAPADELLVLRAGGLNALALWRKALQEEQPRGAVLLVYETEETRPEEILIEVCVQLGSVLLQGAGDGIMLSAPALTAEQHRRLLLGVLQALRLRMSHTEFISCPGCGRTMFNLQETVQRIKAHFGHLPALKIGIMGCVVNGPGEMADAQYGYVGAGRGKVDLYKGQTPVKRGIPQEKAVKELEELIRSEGDWIDPPQEPEG